MADPAIETTAQEIPGKLYFRIGEVSRLAGIKPYVLRFWESEFPGLGPKKSGSGHRLYRRKDVEMVLQIKSLLYEKRFTIEGARKALLAARKTPAVAAKPQEARPVRAVPEPVPQAQGELFGIPAFFDGIRCELREILELLK